MNKYITGKYYDSDQWRMVNNVSKELLGKASSGCQWTLTMSTSQDNGLALMSADVSGIFKSTDYGKSWHSSNVGFGCCGSNCIAIDPKNSNHVIATGESSTSVKKNATSGVYISTDAGDTWEMTLNEAVCSQRDVRSQFAFDESTYDEEKGMCMTIYWSSEKDKYFDGHLYKSTDGGYNWEKVNTTQHDTVCQSGIAISGDGKVLYALHSPKGSHASVYYTGAETLYRSEDQGVTWTPVSIGESGQICVFDTLSAFPSHVYAITEDGVYISKDYGKTFELLTSDGPGKCAVLAISKDGKNWSVQKAEDDTDKLYENAYSIDGGKTWHNSTHDYSDSFMTMHTRRGQRGFFGTNTNRAVAVWGDTILGTDDAGKTWVVSNYGYDVPCSEAIVFNAANSDLAFTPNQDYFASFSTDAGKSWTRLAGFYKDGWSDRTYAGYILDENNIFAITTEKFIRLNPERFIAGTHDGGKTIDRSKTYMADFDSDVISMGTLNNSKIGFIGDLRTTDSGYTFSKMTEVFEKDGTKVEDVKVMGVWCIDYNTGRLYGRDSERQFIYSDDNGDNWKRIGAKYDGILVSLSCDKNGILYYSASENHNNGPSVLGKVNAQTGESSCVCSPFDYKQGRLPIAVDFYNPNIVYAASSRNVTGDYSYGDTCSARSEDGGKTWTLLNRTKDGGNQNTKLAGPRNTYFITINYKQNEVWFQTYCSGIWSLPRIGDDLTSFPGK